MVDTHKISNNKKEIINGNHFRFFCGCTGEILINIFIYFDVYLKKMLIDSVTVVI